MRGLGSARVGSLRVVGTGEASIANSNNHGASDEIMCRPPLSASCTRLAQSLRRPITVLLGDASYRRPNPNTRPPRESSDSNSGATALSAT